MEGIRKPLSEMERNWISWMDMRLSLSMEDHSGPSTSPRQSHRPGEDAVLFAGLQAEGTTSLSESIRTRDHSEARAEGLCAKLTRTATKLSIAGGQKLKASTQPFPAIFRPRILPLRRAALPRFEPGARLPGHDPTRAALLDVITALGGRIKV